MSPIGNLMIGTTLGHYRIVEKIGEGGMGVVYRTHDEHLDRDVALKALPPGRLGDEASRKRFRKEAQALAKLNHPNIETVYEFGSVGGVDFLVLEYVPGKILADKVKRGALPEKEVAQLGTQLAAALEEAHERGIVHRDLKPRNIAVTPKGQLKVLDFGLAKLLAPESEISTTDLLSSMEVAGTLPYMSPEQLRGEDADARSDIYGAGVVLYEMATGKHPFSGISGSALIDAILNTPPPPPGRLKHDLSSTLEQIILKCLQKEPENRYQSARELLVDLRRLATRGTAREISPKPRLSRHVAKLTAMVLLILILVLGASYFASQRFWRRGDAAQRIMLAVLPFDNLSGDPNQDYFSDGLTDEMIAQLGRWQPRRLGVIARTSARYYKGSKKRIDQVGRELSVAYILEGSVRRDERRVRITAQLIRVTDQTPLWIETYERDANGVFAVQSEVASRITQSLALELLPQRSALLRSPTTDSEAHEAYLKGLYYFGIMTGANYDRARAYFERAVQLDPNYAPAYAGLADYYWSTDKLPPKDAMPRAEQFALKSLQLDESLPEGHTALAGIRFFYNWDWAAAEKEFSRSLELNPSGAEAHRMYAIYLASQGNADHAVLEIRRAQQLDPLSLSINTSAGWVFNYTRQYDQAMEQCRKALEIDPDYVSAHDCLGESYLAKGMSNQAIGEFHRAASGGEPVRAVGLARAYGATGRKTEAHKVLDELTKASKQGYFPPYLLGMIHVAMGENEQGLACLEEAYTERDPYLVHLKKDAAFDSIRSDPRFQNLLRRVGPQ
jgi:TolB-like protein/Flp pilus assembly protein TadD